MAIDQVKGLGHGCSFLSNMEPPGVRFIQDDSWNSPNFLAGVMSIPDFLITLAIVLSAPKCDGI
jgi:hypothetical protein